MIQNGSKALKFVEDLHDKVYEQFLEEISTLKKYIQNHGKDPKVEFKPWNFRYWAQKQKKELYNIDDEKLKQYFIREKVFNGIFEIVKRIFNVSINIVPTFVPSKGDTNEHLNEIEVWDKNVMYFEVSDIQTNKKIGGIYVDLYARKNKRCGSWMEQIVYGDIEKGILLL